ncbi:MAG: hypothetical protein HYS87_02660 [Candidatus Colwellbacteria bacterium]|nr:hypothetical protein [Candidatus Colwellbacteria bacterium]
MAGRILLISVLGIIAFGGAFFLLSGEYVVESGDIVAGSLSTVTPTEAPIPELKPLPPPEPVDIENQRPLANPPEIIKAIYATGWSAGSANKINYLIDLIKTTELNAIVIDIKDYSGYVLYDIKIPQVIEYDTRNIQIPMINKLIKRLHDEGIYVIARQTIFQDPALVRARPDLAVKNSITGEPWEDRNKITWIDAASREAWDYNIAIVKDAAIRGFDEINFDYIRFLSDGDLSVAKFPFYNIETTYKKDVIRDFFEYLRQETEGIKISADLFGLTTVAYDDLGIGQKIEYAYENFDFVAPMVYPSHYASGFRGYARPAEFPYEVVFASMEGALQKLLAWENSPVQRQTDPNLPPPESEKRVGGKLRPWLQDFDLGATYDAGKVRAQIKATEEALGEHYAGFMLWDPRNNYTREALLPE